MADSYTALTPEEETRRAGRAKQLLDDPMVRDALDDIERAVIDNIEICPPEKTIAQHQLCMMLGVVRKFRRVFRTHMETGKLVEIGEARKKKFGIF